MAEVVCEIVGGVGSGCCLQDYVGIKGRRGGVKGSGTLGWYNSDGDSLVPRYHTHGLWGELLRMSVSRTVPLVLLFLCFLGVRQPPPPAAPVTPALESDGTFPYGLGRQHPPDLPLWSVGTDAAVLAHMFISSTGNLAHPSRLGIPQYVQAAESTTSPSIFPWTVEGNPHIPTMPDSTGENNSPTYETS